MSDRSSDSGCSAKSDVPPQAPQGSGGIHDAPGSGHAAPSPTSHPRTVDVATCADDMAAAGMVLEFGEFARFELVKRLGRGGMGEVYLARQEGAAGFLQEVAIKRVFTGPGHWVTTSFVEEARILAMLRHDGIVRAHALIALRGSYVLVLEYIEGWTLKELFELAAKKGRLLPRALVCHVLADVADALHYAHNVATDHSGELLRVVHRDVSPANIMVTPSGRAKLLDFGVAKARIEGRQDTSVTSTTIKGKVPYLSPEQASDQRLDGRSDLFSLGSVLVEGLTGEPPFGRSYEPETIQAIVEVTPRHVAQVTRGLPRRLRATSQKLLARVPGKRFATARAVAQALRENLDGLDGPSMVAAQVAALTALPDIDRNELPTERIPRFAGGPVPPGRLRPRIYLALLGAGGLGVLLLLVWLMGRMWPLAPLVPEDAEHAPAIPAKVPLACVDDSGQGAPGLPAQPTEGLLTVNDQSTQVKDVRSVPAAPGNLKALRSTGAMTCEQILRAAAVATALAACGGVRTGAKAGDCAFTPVRTVGGRELVDGFFVAMDSINGGPGCVAGMERCQAVEGAVMAHVGWGAQEFDFPPEGSKLFGRSRIVWGEERFYDEGDRRWYNSVGRLMVLFTELRLPDGTPVPICGVLMGSDNYGGEGVPMLSPNTSLNWGLSSVKLYY